MPSPILPNRLSASEENELPRAWAIAQPSLAESQRPLQLRSARLRNVKYEKDAGVQGFGNHVSVVFYTYESKP